MQSQFPEGLFHRLHRAILVSSVWKLKWPRLCHWSKDTICSHSPIHSKGKTKQILVVVEDASGLGCVRGLHSICLLVDTLPSSSSSSLAVSSELMRQCHMKCHWRKVLYKCSSWWALKVWGLFAPVDICLQGRVFFLELEQSTIHDAFDIYK